MNWSGNGNWLDLDWDWLDLGWGLLGLSWNLLGLSWNLLDLSRDLLNLLNWLMDNLSFNSLIFDSLLISLNWYVFCVFVLVNLRNIVGLVFDSVIVCDFFLSGNQFSSLDSFIFEHWFLIRNIFNSRSSQNWLRSLLNLNRLNNRLGQRLIRNVCGGLDILVSRLNVGQVRDLVGNRCNSWLNYSRHNFYLRILKFVYIFILSLFNINPESSKTLLNSLILFLKFWFKMEPNQISTSPIVPPFRYFFTKTKTLSELRIFN